MSDGKELVHLIQKGWEGRYTRVKWPLILLQPAYKLQEAVALSLGLWPDIGTLAFAESQVAYINDMRNNPYFSKAEKEQYLMMIGATEDDPILDLPYQLMMRLSVAAGNIQPYGGLPVIERKDDALQSMVRLTEFATWAESQGWELPKEFPRAEENESGESKAVSSVKPIPRQRAQEQEMLRIIEDLGYSIDSIPKPVRGRRGLKADVWDRAQGTSVFQSRGVFDKAWERLRKSPDFKEV